MPARTSSDERPSPDRWSLEDALDFEHLTAVDGDAAHADDAFSAIAASDDRRRVFRAWLDRARSRAPATPPGTALGGALRLLDAAAVVVGLALGCALVGGLLSHGDAEPINALLFFGGTVGVQLAVVALALLAALARTAGLRIALVQDAMLALTRVAGRLARTGTAHLDGARRADLAAAHAVLDLRSRRIGPLLACRLLLVTQRFAIAFNVALLAAMALVYLPFVELRFGWQSTYSFTAEGVAAWVRAVASPWSWIGAGLAPTGADVAATRYTRGQLATTLPADAAHAWWPFLLCAIAVYGLALRVAIAALAAGVLRRRLSRLTFTSPDANRLWRRLQGPLATSRGGDERLPEVERDAGATTTGGVAVLVVDADLATRIDAVRAAVEREFGGPVAAPISAGVDDDRLTPDLHAALAAALDFARGPVVIALAADRDPIVAVADFVRAVAGDAPAVTVLLVGATADDERATIWRRFVAIQRLPVDVAVAPC